MSVYRRHYVPGGMFFFTVVTYARREILTTEHGRNILHDAIVRTQVQYGFELFATVLIPDHWHLIMQLPAGEKNYSIGIKRIKEFFTEGWLARGLPEAPVTESQRRRGERGVWQPRFWEHTIRDETDLERRTDYIHWNPRKHGLVGRIRDWPWSSFHRFVQLGHYDIEWGGEEPPSIQTDVSWGE
jgi:putative transposase